MPQLWVGARAVLASAERWIEGGALVVERGRVVEILDTARAVRRARSGLEVADVEGAWLAPGFVNAHAHLELSGLAGRIAPGVDFSAWVARVVHLRNAASARALQLAARSGADRCLATGTTTVGDVDSTGAAERGLARHPLRCVLYREALDAYDPARTATELAKIVRPCARSPRHRIGYSPHAPFTASPALMRGIARRARARCAPIATHWSESEAELAWLADGSGPLAPRLGPSPCTSGLELLANAGLLRAPLALVHGNFPRTREPERVALAGAVVVHCPGSHAWFEREAFPLARYLRAGVDVALGTDSLASNADLDLRREARLLRAGAPVLEPEQVFDMATRAGAKALGLDSVVGELAPGAWADIVAYRGTAKRRRDAIDEILSGAAALESVAIAGRVVRSGRATLTPRRAPARRAR